MRFAFSTLGVPALPIDQVVRLASEHGYHGVELRASEEEPVHTGLSSGERAQVAEKFAKAGVEILTVASYAKVAAAGDDGPVLDELGAAMTLAADLGASFVRVFPGGGDLDQAEADALAARRLAAALRQNNVRPGDRVAILARNSFRYLEVNFACVMVGAILVPLNVRLAKSEIAAIIAALPLAAWIGGLFNWVRMR